MNFIKKIPVWALLETVFFMVVIVVDNLGGKTDGLWLSLLVAGVFSLFAIIDYRKYDFGLPVNHPDQRIPFVQIGFNFVRAVLCIGICFAPMVFGLVSATWWIVGFSFVVLVAAAYATVTSFLLLKFAIGDVKYEG